MAYLRMGLLISSIKVKRWEIGVQQGIAVKYVIQLLQVTAGSSLLPSSSKLSISTKSANACFPAEQRSTRWRKRLAHDRGNNDRQTTNARTLPGATLSLPWVINFKFPLQPYQKYYIAQCEELGFPWYFYGIIILSSVWKAKFFKLCDIIFLVRL